MTQEEMRAHLLQSGVSEEKTERACEAIYENTSINRKSIRDIKNILTGAGLAVKEWTEGRIHNRLQWASGKSDDEMTPQLAEQASGSASADELQVSRLMARLAKPGAVSAPNDNLHMLPERILAFARALPREQFPWDNFKNMEFSLHFLQHIYRFNKAYLMLHDDESREVMMNIIAHRLTQPYEGVTTWPAPQRKAVMEAVDVPSLPNVDGTQYALWHSFMFEQYRAEGFVETDEGDYVIDGGAFIGDSALWFSQKCGETGRVFSFECHPGSYAQLCANVEAHGLGNVTCIQKGLADKESTFMFTDQAHGSGIRADGTIEVECTTIDAFAAKEGLPRVDLIKLDIEGSEAAALDGAKETIRGYRPSIAISAYHLKHDLYALMNQLHDILPDYQFALRHAGKHQYETVLFAFVPRKV
jgi:FkbM family methyltransferase